MLMPRWRRAAGRWIVVQWTPGGSFKLDFLWLLAAAPRTLSELRSVQVT